MHIIKRTLNYLPTCCNLTFFNQPKNSKSQKINKTKLFYLNINLTKVNYIVNSLTVIETLFELIKNEGLFDIIFCFLA